MSQHAILEPVPFTKDCDPTREQSERDYRGLFDANPQPTWIFDAVTLSFLAVNDAAVAKYGYSQEEFLSMSIRDIRTEGERERLEATLPKLPAELRNSGVWVHRLKDGRSIEVEVFSNSLQFQGRPARLVVVRDVTEQRRAERALESRESYYRALIHNALDIITIIDASGRILFESQSLYRVMGYRPKDAVGRSVFDSVHPDDIDRMRRLLKESVAAGLAAATVEIRMRAANGQWKTLEACARNMLHNPAIGGIIVNSRDITKRKQSEEELRISEERLRLAQKAGCIGTWEYSFATDVALGSQGNAELYGETGLCGPVSMAEWLQHVHPDDLDRVGAHFRRCVEARINVEDEFRIVRPDGSIRWFSSKAEVIGDASGNPARLVGVNIDISERKQIEEELAKARDEAVAASQMKSQFLANVSHEIRTPMNAILGLAGLLLDTGLSAEQRADMEIIRGSAMHLLDLINDVLDLAKAEAGGISCDGAPFDLRSTMASVIDLMETPAEQKGLTLKLEYPQELRRLVMGNAGRVRQIALNFIANAVKFSQKGSVTLRVGAAAGNGRIRISVIDSGPGLAAELQSRLFERFVQGDANCNRRHGGTGLGLAISKWLAEAMGGSVGTHNCESGGAEFWVELLLPEVCGEMATKSAQPSSAPVFSQMGRRVLVAEDNGVNQKILVRMLEKRGIRADIAANGLEALQMWRDFPYDLVLMDCQMPEMDGYEAAQQIRSLEHGQSHVPIVAVTAHAGQAERQRCLASGMDSYLPKPFQPSELDQALVQFLCSTAA